MLDMLFEHTRTQSSSSQLDFLFVCVFDVDRFFLLGSWDLRPINKRTSYIFQMYQLHEFE